MAEKDLVSENKGRITASVEALQTALEEDKAALEEKGVTVPAEANHSDVPKLIGEIESGGSEAVSTVGYTIEKVEGYYNDKWDTATGPTGDPSKTVYPQQNGIIYMSHFFPYVAKPVGIAVHLKPKPGYDDSSFFYGPCPVFRNGYARNTAEFELINTVNDSETIIKYFTVTNASVTNYYWQCPLFLFGYQNSNAGSSFTTDNGVYVIVEASYD